MKKLLCLVLILMFSTAQAGSLYVTADILNGRARPDKHSQKEAFFDYGDKLEPTGKFHGSWIEVEGGEPGTVWVSINYVSELDSSFTVQNDKYAKIKIRKYPVNGGVVAYLKRGKKVKIDRVVLGWGHCSKGWIDLSLVTELEGW